MPPDFQKKPDRKLTAVKKKLKKNSIGGPVGVKTKDTTNYNNPETTTAGDCHLPEDAYKDQATSSSPPSTKNAVTFGSVLPQVLLTVVTSEP